MVFVTCATNSVDELFSNDESARGFDFDQVSDLTWQLKDDANDPLEFPQPNEETFIPDDDVLLPLSSVNEASPFDLGSSLITDASCSSGSSNMKNKWNPQVCADSSGQKPLEPLLGQTGFPDDLDEKEFAANLLGADLAFTKGSDAQNGCPSVEPFVPRYQVCDSGRRKADNFWYPPMNCLVLKNCERRQCILLLS